MIYLRLFFEFFKTGLFSVGGGMATIPFLSRMADKTGWFTQAQLADMVAISESTPGPIGVNMASYVGFTTAGIPGVIVATLGLITPCYLVILIVAHFLQKFRSSPLVDKVFYGLRPASAGLIAVAGWSVVCMALVNTKAYELTGNLLDLVSIKGLVLAAVVWLGTNLWKKGKKLHPVAWIALSAVAGIVFRFAGA
ncbi:MAG: chromate transporter [Clostridia bacterium]|nr:chromate transporter [Clostridia bacterium]